MDRESREQATSEYADEVSALEWRYNVSYDKHRPFDTLSR